jgi:TP901 family phage tail tape measure protein
MAKQIKATDLFEKEDIFAGIRDSAQQAITKLEAFKQEAVDTATVLKNSLKNAGFEDTKSLNEFVKNTKKLNELKENSIQIDKQLADLRKLNAQAEREEVATKKAALKLQQDEEKAREKAANAAKKQQNAYTELVKSTRDLKNQSKDLAAQMLQLEEAGKRNTKEYRDLAKQYGTVTAAAAKYDQELKQIDARVGDNFRNVGNYQSALSGLQNVMGNLGIAFGLGTVVQGVGKTVVEFDQAVADLVSITGAGGKDLEFFKEQAISMGKGVEGGASAVIEAYKLIGSAKPELLNNAEALNAVTESAITLAHASGMELPEAATALTDAMNQFGAPAEEAGRFIDALANGALFGSAEIPQVTEALLKFGAVSRTANVSLEESTALIESLAEKGLKGAEAGTALRNVMLLLSAPDALPKEAQKQLDKLGISFAEIQDTSKPFAQRLESLKPLLKDNAALVDIFGKENAVAATNLIANTDRIADLTEKMYTQGTANKQAEDRTKTLSFALNQLKESWNEVVLGFMNGSGSTKVLTSSIKFLANNLGTILSVLGKLVIAWGAYKTLQLSLQAIEKARAFSFAEFGRNLAAQIPMTKQYAAAQKEAAAATKEAGNSAKGAGSAMSAVPWMALVAVLIEVAKAFYDIATNAKEAREQQERFDRYKTRASDESLKNITAETDELDKQLKQREREKQLALSKAKTDKERQKIESDYAKLREQDIKRTKTQITGYRDSAAERLRQYRTEKEELNKLALIRQNGTLSPKEAQRFMQILRSTGATNANELYKAFGVLDAKILGTGTRVNEYNKALKAVDENLKDVSTEVELNSNAQEDNTDKIGAKIPKMKELNTEMEKYNEYLTKQNELLYEQDQFDTEQQIKTLNDEIKNLTDEALMLAEAGIVPDTSLLQAKMQERLELEKDLIGEKLKMELQAIEDRYKAESDKAREQITSNYQKLIGQDGLTPAERKKIDDQYKAQLAQFDLDELQRNADKQLELKLTKEKALAEGVELDKKFGEETIQIKNDVNDKLTESEQRRIDRENKKKEEEQEKLKKRLENQNAWIKWTADYFIEQSNRKIAQIDKEIAAAENQQNILQELAANGNINAKESLAEQQKIIDQANRRKEQEQRRQQMIELVSGVYQTYNSKVAEGAEHPLMETIRDTVMLQQFANTLLGQMPAFLEGTEDTGTNGYGVDGKGGFHAILHPNERVVPKSLNEQIGSMSNEQLARLAQEYQNGKLIRGSQAGSSMELALLANKLDTLTDTIKQKPETNIELGEITSSMMEIVKSTKQGNTLKTNRYKIRK